MTAKDSIGPAMAADPVAIRSVAVLRDGQSESGAFVASPTFSQYGFCWLRDGSFCALALDRVGHRSNADAFHLWVALPVLSTGSRCESGASALGRGDPIDVTQMPPTRFHLDGTIEPKSGGGWPNFQLDGYGTWLAIVSQRPLEPDEALAARVVAEYLRVGWQSPCFDCWEEGGERWHASTLMAVSGGLRGAAIALTDDSLRDVADEIVSVLRERFTFDGSFRKSADDDRVDASLLWAALPHAAFPLDDAAVVATTERIRRDLIAPTGGVHRYLGDSYYGGGEWLLLTAWLGWVDAASGQRAGWEHARDWIRGVAEARLDLPEQISTSSQQPEMVGPWTDQWGPSASPLLWSHAMYLLLMVEGWERGWR